MLKRAARPVFLAIPETWSRRVTSLRACCPIPFLQYGKITKATKTETSTEANKANEVLPTDKPSDLNRGLILRYLRLLLKKTFCLSVLCDLSVLLIARLSSCSNPSSLRVFAALREIFLSLWSL